MNRNKELLRFISKDALGVEIAPYFNPLTPKSGGYNCRIVDVFNEVDLRGKAEVDPNIPNERVNEIEPVDFVGDASHLDVLLKDSPEFGNCEYIVSSHNFEHLPNPIRFLQGCEKVLRPGGTLSMAIPDYRACFDHFRFPTRLADWLEAYREDRNQPAPATVLDGSLSVAMYLARDGSERPGFRIGSANFERFSFAQDVPALYQRYLKGSEEYIDTHCSVTCPEILHLLLSDLIHLGLIGFEIVSISRTRTFEYFVHLRKPDQTTEADQEKYKKKRPYLLDQAREAIGSKSKGGLYGKLIRSLHDKWALESMARNFSHQLYVVDNR
ncbi:MAG: methyltransferase domain-containing protein [Pseudomonadota bacterium]